MRVLLSTAVALAAVVMLDGCSAPAPVTAPASPSPAVVQPPPAAAPVERAAPATTTAAVRLAPRDPALEQWKLRAAQQIHSANKTLLFEGRPHHLLKAVIVIEATVDRAGQVTQLKVMRSLGIKSLEQAALASLKAASPLPPPPATLVARGPLVFTETWLFQNDGRFQVRTLALPQE